MNRNRISLLVGGLIILAACDSSSGTVVTPFLTFTYSGATSGTFNAAGTPPSDESNKPWAVGVRDATDNTIGVLAVMPSSAGGSHLAGLTFPDATGTVNFDIDCAPGPTCASFGIIFEITSGASTATLYCALEAGAVTVTTASEKRATGTFSGTGTCDNGTGTGQGNITITAGSFDVTLVASTPTA